MSLSTSVWFKSVIAGVCLGAAVGQSANAQNAENEAQANKINSWVTKFGQLGTSLPTPNSYRTASGAPGPEYWQQKADYHIDVKLDDDKRRIEGKETITYHNNSPDSLRYLWLQLDQNQMAPGSDTYTTESDKLSPNTRFDQLNVWLTQKNFEGGYAIDFVRDKDGRPLPYVINKTMMRVDLPTALPPHAAFSLGVGWSYNINDQRILGGRTGYEYFQADDNYLYEIAHWFPRMAVYSDCDGWQHKQFLGRGEFTLPFGDYKVTIDAPADFIVGATGVLQNPGAVLTANQMRRLKEAERALDRPVLIVTPEEAAQNETSRTDARKKWTFHAQNVRDFAFAASRKFIWDAMTAKVGQRNVLCMSYYPKEGNPLWEKYSTQAVAHTIRTYSKYTVDYSYPVAISVNGPVGGMEYPMICFNGPRPEPDGTYNDRTKYALISVIIHEVGHNFFPMIINSDERQWTWMDEGLNSFVEFLSEQEWSRDYPSRRGPAEKIVDYMKGDAAGLEPIMTNSESIIQFGNNAYGKPATALNILRETVMGRELFDFAFKEYCRRWAFKHPTPADFFRTLEDASAVDLDWFWRGWFWGVEPVDVAIENVTWWKLDSQNPDVEKPALLSEKDSKTPGISSLRNKEVVRETLTERNPELQDFYDNYDPLKITVLDRKQYELYVSSLTEQEKKLLEKGLHFYQIDFKNVGGLVTPLILEFGYADNTKEIVRIPAEIWRKNDKNVSKVFILEKPIASVTLDPHLETADIDKENNYFPRRMTPTRFQLYKQKQAPAPNQMQIQKKIEGMERGNG